MCLFHRPPALCNGKPRYCSNQPTSTSDRRLCTPRASATSPAELRAPGRFPGALCVGVQSIYLERDVGYLMLVVQCTTLQCSCNTVQLHHSAPSSLLAMFSYSGWKKIIATLLYSTCYAPRDFPGKIHRCSVYRRYIPCLLDSAGRYVVRSAAWRGGWIVGKEGSRGVGR